MATTLTEWRRTIARLKIKKIVKKWFSEEYKSLILGSLLSFLLFFAIGPYIFNNDNIPISQMYEENSTMVQYKLPQSSVKNYHNILSNLKKISYERGFFTIREFMPNTPQYKIFVVYFQNREAFSLSLEPKDDIYAFHYRLGRIDENGNYANSDSTSLIFEHDDYASLENVILKFLFGRQPIKIVPLEE